MATMNGGIPHESEQSPIVRPMRPQYHFFYGSTSPNDDPSACDPRSSTNTEQESLIGESLVPTDNEEDPPHMPTDSFDLQHVLISNGDNGGMRHVVGAGTNHLNNHMNMNGGSNHKRNSGSNGNGGPSDHDSLLNSEEGGDRSSMTSSILNCHGNQTMVHIVGLVGCMTICMVIFAVTLFPTGSQKTVDGAMGSAAGFTAEKVKRFIQSFPIADRSQSNDPARLFMNKDLFHPDLHYSGSDTARIFNFAFPTGAFWTNLVLPPTADRGFSYPIVVYPYAYKWAETQLIVSYPYHHRKEETKAIHDYFIPDLTFAIAETTQQRHITNFDPLSVTLQFTTNDNNNNNKGGGTWTTYLVQGSPYVTIEYDNVTPKIHALSTFKNVLCPGEEGYSGPDEDEFDDFSDDDVGDGDENYSTRRRTRELLGVCGASVDDDGNTLLRGVQFVLQSQEGVHWFVFSSEPITFFHDTRRRTEVVSTKAYKGTIRLAIIPPSSKVGSNSNGLVQISSSTGLRRLVYHASVYPVAAKVDYVFLDPAVKTTTTSLGKTILSGLTGLTGGGGSTATTTTKTSTTTKSGSTGTVLAQRSRASTRTASTKSSSSGRVARVSFHFQVKGANSSANTAAAATGKTTGLLMLSLPHHEVAFTKGHTLDAKHFDLVYRCIKGAMTPVVGSTWTYEEKLFSLGFDSDPTTTNDGEGEYSSSSSTSKTTMATPDQVLADKAVRKLLADNLETDLNIAPPTRTENIYGYGKQIARLAQLAHISDRLVGTDDELVEVSASSSSSNNNSSSSSSSGGSNRRRLGSPSSSGLDARLITIRQNAADKLSGFLELLLTNQIKDSLLFDASLGGLVSTDGLEDFNVDFGNGRYNDHHFHYGYLLYACAVMGRLNSTFVKEYGDKVDSIMHDVAYNTNMNDGSFFPLARHMSWFDGHSYASGLFPFGNGKSQESSSEAVNCYYGAYLWSLVRSGSQDNPSSDTSAMTDFARLLLAMEVRGAKTYWHMLPPPTTTASSSSSSSSSSMLSSGSSNITIEAATTTTTTTSSAATNPLVYSAKFAENYMVGNVGMLDAICSTWFGTENLYVHMINFIPVTSITRELFNKEYVAEEYAHVISQYPNAEMAWKGYVVSDHALVAPMKAWKEALTLMSAQLDSGFSKTQALYFILTSPGGFDLSQISSDTTSGGDDDNSSGSSGSSASDDNAACVNHAGCLEAGLQGLCCPTTTGIMLGCCGSQDSSNSGSSGGSSGDSSGGSDDASCLSHAGCSGLVGQCCPTGSGVFLGCCDGRRRS